MGQDQASLHEAEMSQDERDDTVVKPIILHKNWNDHEMVEVRYDRRGHGGGDKRLQDRILQNPDNPDPLRHAAGSRDGAMSILVGIAARKSIETGAPIKIGSLTDLVPQEKRK